MRVEYKKIYLKCKNLCISLPAAIPTSLICDPPQYAGFAPKDDCFVTVIKLSSCGNENSSYAHMLLMATLEYYKDILITECKYEVTGTAQYIITLF